jgi:hypothetical protein
MRTSFRETKFLPLTIPFDLAPHVRTHAPLFLHASSTLLTRLQSFQTFVPVAVPHSVLQNWLRCKRSIGRSAFGIGWNDCEFLEVYRGYTVGSSRFHTSYW